MIMMMIVFFTNIIFTYKVIMNEYFLGVVSIDFLHVIVILKSLHVTKLSYVNDLN